MFDKISIGFDYFYKINRSLLDGKELMHYFEALITMIKLIVIKIMSLYIGTNIYMYVSHRIIKKHDVYVDALIKSV
jgi:hypothetical protein